MRRCMIVLALTAVLALFGGGLAFAQASAPPGSWSAADCLTCHEKAGNPAFEDTKHAKAQMAAQKGGATPTLKGKTSRELNAICLSCHEKDAQSSWMTSMHDR